MRTYIHHTLQKPQVLHPGVSAVWTDGAFVGYCMTEINAGILEAIYAGKNLRPDHAHEWLVCRISGAIVDVPCAHRSYYDVSYHPKPAGALSSSISMHT